MDKAQRAVEAAQAAQAAAELRAAEVRWPPSTQSASPHGSPHGVRRPSRACGPQAEAAVSEAQQESSRLRQRVAQADLAVQAKERELDKATRLAQVRIRDCAQ